MTERGVKTLFERMSDLAQSDPKYALPEPPAPPEPKQRGITDAEAKVKNRALTAFNYWLQSIQTRQQLDKFDPVEVAKRYPPLTIDDVRQMIAVKWKALR